MKYCLHLIKNDYKEGSCFREICVWLSESPEINTKLMEEVENILIDTIDENVKRMCNFFFEIIKEINDLNIKSQILEQSEDIPFLSLQKAKPD